MLVLYGPCTPPVLAGAVLDGVLFPDGRCLDERLRLLPLPVATLTLIGVGGIARFVRGAMFDVLGQPFIRTAHAKGVSPRQVTRSEERRVGEECRSRWSPYH